MSVHGDSRHARRLRNLRRESERLGRVVFVASDMIRTEARLSITRGSISGKGHVASKPGDPPNRDTGHLDTNITNKMTGPLTAEVRSNASYSAALEFGTSKMHERPFMRPASAKVRPDIRELLRVEVRKMVKES